MKEAFISFIVQKKVWFLYRWISWKMNLWNKMCDYIRCFINTKTKTKESWNKGGKWLKNNTRIPSNMWMLMHWMHHSSFAFNCAFIFFSIIIQFFGIFFAKFFKGLIFLHIQLFGFSRHWSCFFFEKLLANDNLALQLLSIATIFLCRVFGRSSLFNMALWLMLPPNFKSKHFPTNDFLLKPSNSP